MVFRGKTETPAMTGSGLSNVYRESSGARSAANVDDDEIIVKDEKVSVLRHAKGKVYLLGCHHNREQSALAVQELLRIVKPHIVAVELCRTNLERFSVADKPASIGSDSQTQRAHAAYMAVVPARLKDRAVGEELLLSLISESLKYERSCTARKRLVRDRPSSSTSSVGREYRVRPKVFCDVVIGREITVPFGDHGWHLEKGSSVYLVSSRVPYKIMLADKPVEDTFCSIAAALSDEERTIVQIYRNNFLKLFVEFSTTKSIVTNMLEKNHKLYRAIVKERDEYMARSMRNALENVKIREPNELTRVVGVVGKNHMDGIAKYWTNHLSVYRLYKPTVVIRPKRVSVKRRKIRKNSHM